MLKESLKLNILKSLSQKINAKEIRKYYVVIIKWIKIKYHILHDVVKCCLE